MRRLVIAAAVGAGLVSAAVPSLAASTPKQSVPVYIWRTPDGGVCFAVSEQVPHCVSPKPVTDILPGDFHVGPVTVGVSTANGGLAVYTALGSQPLVAASIENGWVCVGFSDEVPTCYPLASQN